MNNNDLKIKSVILREDKKYSKEDLKKYFSKSTDAFLEETLKTFCAKIKDHKFTFHYVGLAEYKSPGQDYLIFFVPKYMQDDYLDPEKLLEKDSAEFKSFRKLFKTLNQYQIRSEKQKSVEEQEAGGILNPEENSQGKNHYLALAVHLVQDYLQNGVYENTITQKHLCGPGEIDWQKTIDGITPVIQGNRPYYVNYWTDERVNHSNTIIARIHECIVSECSRNLSKTGLADLLDIETPFPYEGDLSDFGDNEAILYQIYRELSVQFVTRKQNLLKLLLAYVEEKPEYDCEDCLSLYGTSSFHAVWESVCASVFGDQREQYLPKDLQGENKTWKNLIPKPVWNIGGKIKESDETLEPDFVAEDEEPLEKKGTLKTDFVAEYGGTFYILDAKYYCPDFEKDGSVTGVPGIGDIDKQHLYQLAYAPVIRKEGWKTVNAFLMPARQGITGNVGTVYNPIFGYIGNISVVLIQLLLLDPEQLFDQYLENKKDFGTLIKLKPDLKIIEQTLPQCLPKTLGKSWDDLRWKAQITPCPQKLS